MESGAARELIDLLEVERLAAAPVQPDASASNRSSIAVLLELDGVRVLLPGDLPDDDLAAAIRDLLLRTGEERLRLDAMVVPHHGGRSAMTRQLLDLVDCPRFLVSTDGSAFRHPDRETIARIVTGVSGPTNLAFNYRTERNDTWSDLRLRARFGYSATYPATADGGLTIDLLDPIVVAEPPRTRMLVLSSGDGVVVTGSGPTTNFTFDASAEGIASLERYVVERLERWAAPDSDESALERALLPLAATGRELAVGLGEITARVDRDDTSIQLVRSGSGPFLPLEFVYDHQLSAGATLCPTWRESVEAGTCVGCDDADGRQICPAAFWALRHRIARGDGRPDGLLPRMLAQPLSSVLLVAGEQVPAVVRDRTVAELRAGELGLAVAVAPSWRTARADLSEESWSALAVVAHGQGGRDGRPALRIGDDVVRLEDLVDAVRRMSVPPGLAIVLVSTDSSRVAGAIGSALVAAGCEMCITNLGAIRPGHAGRAISEIIGSISTAGDVLGAAVRHARRRLMLEANPLALSMLVFGNVE